MELDFVSSEKAEGTAHTLLANPFKHMSQYGLEVMSSCAKIFGQGNLTAALCFAPSLSLQCPKNQGTCRPGLKGFFHPPPNFHPLSWCLISRLHTHISHCYFVLIVPSGFLSFSVFFFFMSSALQMCVPFPNVPAFLELVLLCMCVCDSETLGDVQILKLGVVSHVRFELFL